MIPANELEEELKKPFSLDIWRGLFEKFLPGLSLFLQPRNIPLVSKTERSIAESLQQIGTARLVDSKGIGLFVIEAKPEVDLARNRVGLRHLSARWIDQADIHAALTLSYQPDVPYYRLTYAARDTALTPDLQLTTRETATRRFTYVLGEGERRRTAGQRLSLLTERRPELQLHDVTEAFSVEKLNKEFFSDFCRIREALAKELESRSRLSRSNARIEAQTILNRLLFLYFLQRKGWLNRQRDYLSVGFRHFADKPIGTDFYTRFLSPVFTIVSTEWAQREKLTGHLEESDPHRHDLPFLNGGLFADELAAVHTDESIRRRRELRIRNDVFEHVFTDLFDRYNFTIHEDSERDAEVAVDPEMLGRIFEELVLTSEDSESGGKSRRHDTGSHYTPRPIVRYLCRDSLAAWLAARPPFSLASDSRSRVDTLLSLDASVGMDEETWTRLREALTPEQAAIALDGLSDLRACDPAVGSGAFPLGLLHELVNFARLVDGCTRGKDPAETDSGWLYDTKKRLIERCLYGVDIQEEALEICKLRLWLSLMVDHELGVDPDQCERRAFASALKKVEPLPNLEFKIRRANALIDMIRGHRLFVDRPRQDDRMRIVIRRLTDAKHEFYSAGTAADKRRLRFAIYQAIAELAQHELSWMKQHLGLNLDDSEQIRAQLQQYQEAEGAVGEIRRQLEAARKLKAAAQEDALERLRLWWDDSKYPTFVWHFDFAEVFHRVLQRRSTGELIEENGSESIATSFLAGFDEMIGNPPYIRIQALKRIAPEDVGWYREHYYAAKKGNYDLYVVFIERALNLLHDQGQLAFICPHKFFNAQYGEPLRTLIANGRYLRHVVHFGDQQIFPGATNYVCLLFLSRAGAESCRFVRADALPLWMATQQGAERSVAPREITASEWNFVAGSSGNVFEKVMSHEGRLGDQARIFQGLVTGADRVFCVEPVRSSRGDATVVADEKEREWEIEKELLRPFLHDVSLRSFAEPEPNWMILFPYHLEGNRAQLLSSEELEDSFPGAWAYLKYNEGRLRSRERGKWDHDGWHAFGRSQNLTQMETPKLVVQVIAQTGRFAFDPLDTYFTGGGNGPYYGLRWLDAAEKRPLKFLQAILNSAVSNFVIRNVSSPFRGGYWSFGKRFIEQIPIPESEASAQRLLVTLVDWLLFLHGQPTVRTPVPEHQRDPELATWFERWVNAIVYDLFFPEELHSRGLSFVPLTEDFAPSVPSANIDAKEILQAARGIVERLSEAGHPLRRALDQLQALDLVRTIEAGA
jgi:Eco57I restriction-modification methylase